MTKFLIKYTDPETNEPAEHVGDYEDWIGRAEVEGEFFGPVITITAREWAQDHAYALADKGSYTIIELKQ